MEGRNAIRFVLTSMLALAGTLSLAGIGAAAAGAARIDLAQAENPNEMPGIEGEGTPEEEKKAAKDAFERFKGTIDMLNENIGPTYGGPPFRKVEYVEPHVVKIIPDKSWMAVPATHYRNAMMLYGMWRNANQFRPVTMMITDDKGGDYITLKDTPTGLIYRAKQQ
jgi:hypothetical protein